MPSAEKLSVTLSPEMVQALRESVEVGDYVSTSEAVRDAVRIWQPQRHEDAGRLNVIRARIRRSLDDPRPNLSSEDVRTHLEALMRVIKVEYRPEADNDLTEIFEYANGPWRASAHPCKKGFRPAHPNLEKAKDSALPKPNISSATDSRSTHPSQIQRDII